MAYPRAHECGPEAIRFLVNERDIWGVAVDTISFDVGIEGTYAAHRELLGAGKWAHEGLNHLGQLPATGATVFVGAPKVRGATGGIAWVVALVPRNTRAQATLDGVWRSASIETIAGARPTYRTRSFSFEGDRWSVEYIVFADAAGTPPILRGRNAGRLVLGKALRLSGAVEADFHFDRRSLTPLVDSTAAALTAAGCGSPHGAKGNHKTSRRRDARRFGCRRRGSARASLMRSGSMPVNCSSAHGCRRAICARRSSARHLPKEPRFGANSAPARVCSPPRVPPSSM